MEKKILVLAKIKSGDGTFESGDVVRIENEHGVDLGRGMCRYSLAELAVIRGKNSDQVTRILKRPATEVIHRDDLVLL